jgi:glycosyltransferase involved in cell wall biosynthesis
VSKKINRGGVIIKICFVNPTKSLRRPIAELMDCLVERGHDISLICPDDIKKNHEITTHYVNNREKINIIAVPTLFITNVGFPIFSPYTLYKKTKDVFKKSDVIHIWGYFYPSSIILLMMSKLVKKDVKSILTIDTFPGYSFQSHNKILDLALRIYVSIFGTIIFSIPNKITIYSDTLKKYCQNAHIPQEKIEILTTGVDINKFNPNVDCTPIRKEFEIKGSDILILFIGFLVPRKNIPLLIELTKLLVIYKSNTVMMIVGDDPYNKEHMKKYRDMTPKDLLDKNIIFTGYRKDIPQLINACDIFVFPSIGEGLPGVLMEAAACGKPIIASDIEGGTSDIVKHGENGFLAEPGNLESFFNYTKMLIGSDILRNEMGAASLEKIKTFDWNVVTCKYEKLYNSLDD